MKYTNPMYARENVETEDILSASPFDVAYKSANITVEDPDNPGQYITKEVVTTQVTVDIGALTKQF